MVGISFRKSVARRILVWCDFESSRRECAGAVREDKTNEVDGMKMGKRPDETIKLSSSSCPPGLGFRCDNRDEKEGGVRHHLEAHLKSLSA